MPINSGVSLDWPSFWAMLDNLDDERKAWLLRSLNDTEPPFLEYLKGLSDSYRLSVLTGCPIRLCVHFVHLLSRKSAIRLIDTYPLREDQVSLSSAWKKANQPHGVVARARW